MLSLEGGGGVGCEDLVLEHEKPEASSIFPGEYCGILSFSCWRGGLPIDTRHDRYKFLHLLACLSGCQSPKLPGRQVPIYLPIAPNSSRMKSSAAVAHHTSMIRDIGGYYCVPTLQSMDYKFEKICSIRKRRCRRQGPHAPKLCACSNLYESTSKRVQYRGLGECYCWQIIPPPSTSVLWGGSPLVLVGVSLFVSGHVGS